ncbi:MAG: class I SAM-dependent methyltransferase [Actinomycetota bacterium]
MKWFGRNKERPASAAPAQSNAPTRAPSRASDPASRRADWRRYDEVSAEYARAVAPHLAPIAADLLALAEANPGARLLDVGTGTGIVLEAARALDMSGTGLDPSAEMLAFGKRADPGLALVAAETMSLPFREATFDVAAAAFVIPFIPKLDGALYDVKRALRPGGCLVTSTWENGEDELTKTWRELAERAVGIELLRDALREAEPWESLGGDRARLEGALRDAGFHPVRVEHRRYKLQLSRDDYVAWKETGTMGRFVSGMLGDEWPAFIEQARATYAATFPEMLVDFRDVLLAVATKP